MSWLSEINWRLFDDLDLTDLAPLREPVLWLTVIATAVQLVVDGVAGGLSWVAIVVVVVNAVAGLLARAQVSPPLAPRRVRSGR